MDLSVDSCRESTFRNSASTPASGAEHDTSSSYPVTAAVAPAYGQLLDRFRPPNSPRNSTESPRRSSISYTSSRQEALANSPRLSLDQECAQSPMASPRDADADPDTARAAQKRNGLSATLAEMAPVELPGGIPGVIPGETLAGETHAAATTAEGAAVGEPSSIAAGVPPSGKRPVSAPVHRLPMEMGQTMQIGGFRCALNQAHSGAALASVAAPAASVLARHSKRRHAADRDGHTVA